MGFLQNGLFYYNCVESPKKSEPFEIFGRFFEHVFFSLRQHGICSLLSFLLVCIEVFKQQQRLLWGGSAHQNWRRFLSLTFCDFFYVQWFCKLRNKKRCCQWGWNPKTCGEQIYYITSILFCYACASLELFLRTTVFYRILRTLAKSFSYFMLF